MASVKLWRDFPYVHVTSDLRPLRFVGIFFRESESLWIFSLYIPVYRMLLVNNEQTLSSGRQRPETNCVRIKWSSPIGSHSKSQCREWGASVVNEDEVKFCPAVLISSHYGYCSSALWLSSFFSSTPFFPNIRTKDVKVIPFSNYVCNYFFLLVDSFKIGN